MPAVGTFVTATWGGFTAAAFAATMPAAITGGVVSAICFLPLGIAGGFISGMELAKVEARERRKEAAEKEAKEKFEKEQNHFNSFGPAVKSARRRDYRVEGENKDSGNIKLADFHECIPTADFTSEEQQLLDRVLAVDITNVQARLDVVPKEIRRGADKYHSVTRDWAKEDPISAMNYTLSWLVNDLDRGRQVLDEAVRKNFFNSSIADELQEAAELFDTVERESTSSRKKSRFPKLPSRINLLETQGSSLSTAEIVKTKKFFEGFETYSQNGMISSDFGNLGNHAWINAQ